MRIGNPSACDALYTDRLMKNIMNGCQKRTEVIDKIRSCRVFVATASAMSYQMDLFKIKSFDVAIFDEATQILEPQILGLLSAVGADKQCAIKKFILIGDYKQLPAVVQQSDEDADVKSPLLKEIGIRSFKESLFERLYRFEQNAGRADFCDMLTRQGRMHPEVGDFASRYFYNNNLNPIPLQHQIDSLQKVSLSDTDIESVINEAGDISDIIPYPDAVIKDLASFITTRRLGFVSAVSRHRENTVKVNQTEAVYVALILKLWLKAGLCESENVADSVGIITPYRAQIAMIRHKLMEYNIPNAMDIIIDTVERFQGGQKDLIIYSCCMNEAYQLNFLSNTIEENNTKIDRKLNVAMTRARKQMFIIGNPDILSRDLLYNELIKYNKEKGNFM